MNTTSAKKAPTEGPRECVQIEYLSSGDLNLYSLLWQSLSTVKLLKHTSDNTYLKSNTRNPEFSSHCGLPLLQRPHSLT